MTPKIRRILIPVDTILATTLVIELFTTKARGQQLFV